MASALIYLAHGGTYLTTALMVRQGISEASVLRSVRLFCRAVNHRFSKSMIKFPTTLEELERVSDSFEARSGIKGIIGAIDGSHIRVAPPKRDQHSYYNRKRQVRGGTCRALLPFSSFHSRLSPPVLSFLSSPRVVSAFIPSSSPLSSALAASFFASTSVFQAG